MNAKVFGNIQWAVYWSIYLHSLSHQNTSTMGEEPQSKQGEGKIGSRYVGYRFFSEPAHCHYNLDQMDPFSSHLQVLLLNTII